MKPAIAVTLALLVASQTVEAKRMPPPKVDPVVYNGVHYVAPNESGRIATVEAWNEEGTKKLWTTVVFRTPIRPLVEEDAQWVFIKRLAIAGEQLLVIDERSRRYSVDLETHRAKRLE